MNTGYTSKTALGTARIALLAGASVAAIFAAGSANAQTPPGIDTSNYILENLNGTASATATNTTNGVPNTLTWGKEATNDNYTYTAATTSNATNTYANGDVLIQNGAIVNPAAAAGSCTAANPCTWATPTASDPANSYQWVQATYANVAAAAGLTALSANPTSATVAVTGTYAVGDYVINTTTGQIVNPTAANCPPGGACQFVTPASVDPKTQTALIGDVAANSPVTGTTSPTGTATTTYNGGVAYTNGNHSTVIGPNGVTATGAVTGGSLTDGTATLSNGSLTGAVNGTFSGTVSAGTLSVTGATTTTGITNTGNVATTTLSVGGAAVPTSGAAIAGGLNVTGGTTTDVLTVNGNGTFNGTGANAGSTTTVNGGLVTLSSPGNGSITLNGTVDPTITVTNGVTQTQIHNGTTTDTGIAGSAYGLVVGGTAGSPGTVSVGVNGSSLGVNVTGSGATAGQTAGVGTLPSGAIGLGAANSNGAVGITGSGILVSNAAATPQFAVGSNGTISAEGNRIQDVGTPVNANDAANKAYVDKQANKGFEGTAIALAISQPVFLPGQTFAMRAGWGDYEGQNAFGLSAAGVIAHNVFGYGSTLALDGGVGVGGNYGGVAGKAGLTLGFGGGSVPLK